MVKAIEVPEEFLQVDGRPFRTAKRDKEGNLELQKDGKGNVLMAEGGGALIEQERADFPTKLKDFLNIIFQLVAQPSQRKKELGIDGKELKMEDSAHATGIFRAIQVYTDGVIELENSDYDWLKTKIDEYGILTFGINAQVFKEAVEKITDLGMPRAERRREKSKGREDG